MAKKLYVGNLSYQTTNDSLQAAFAAFGTVESASVIMDKMSGRSRGFGFVEMSTEEEAQAAIAGMNGTNLDGRQITVNEARPQQAGGGAGGRGGAGGYGRPRGNGGNGGYGGGYQN